MKKNVRDTNTFKVKELESIARKEWSNFVSEIGYTEPFGNDFSYPTEESERDVNEHPNIRHRVPPLMII